MAELPGSAGQGRGRSRPGCASPEALGLCATRISAQAYSHQGFSTLPMSSFKGIGF